MVEPYRDSRRMSMPKDHAEAIYKKLDDGDTRDLQRNFCDMAEVKRSRLHERIHFKDPDSYVHCKKLNGPCIAKNNLGRNLGIDLLSFLPLIPKKWRFGDVASQFELNKNIAWKNCPVHPEYKK